MTEKRKPCCEFRTGGNTQALLDTVYAAFDREGMVEEKAEFLRELEKCTCSGQVYKLIKDSVISSAFVGSVADFFN